MHFCVFFVFFFEICIFNKLFPILYLCTPKYENQCYRLGMEMNGMFSNRECSGLTESKTIRGHTKLKMLIRFRGLKDFKCNSKEFGIFLAMESNRSVLNRII